MRDIWTNLPTSLKTHLFLRRCQNHKRVSLRSPHEGDRSPYDDGQKGEQGERKKKTIQYNTSGSLATPVTALRLPYYVLAGSRERRQQD